MAVPTRRSRLPRRSHHFGEDAMDRASLLQSLRKAHTPDDFRAIATHYSELKQEEQDPHIRHHLCLVEQSYRGLAKSTELLICSTEIVAGATTSSREL